MRINEFKRQKDGGLLGYNYPGLILTFTKAEALLVAEVLVNFARSSDGGFTPNPLFQSEDGRLILLGVEEKKDE